MKAAQTDTAQQCSEPVKGIDSVMATSKAVMCSLTHLRPLTCAASSSASRIVPHPPDLIKWVTREGGFVHRAVKIAPQLDPNGYGLGLVAKEEIPMGSDLIVLPQHLPLHFSSFDDDSVLLQLARHVPGNVYCSIY